MKREATWAEAVFEVVSRSLDHELIPRKKRSPKKITAYHEAGHAVIDLYHRIPPDGATIIPNEERDSAGSMTLGWQKYHDIEGYYLEHREEDEEYDPLLVILSNAFAGMLSSFICSGKLSIAGLQSDLNDCSGDILRYEITELKKETINTVTNYTLTVLMENWEHVEKIAGDLIIHKTLDKQYFQDFYKSTTFHRIDPIVVVE
jgi:ATP-dependent Zn protease